MRETVTTEEFVKNLYAVLLNRVPDDAEVRPHVEELARGVSLAQLSESIASSEEAKTFRLSRIGELINQDHGAPARKFALEIAVDDLMIAYGYEAFGGRSPAHFEVARRLRSIANGAPLADPLADIASSDEAASHVRLETHLPDARDVFARYVSVVYKACLHRTITEPEIETWYSHYLAGAAYRDILINIYESGEAKEERSGGSLAEWDDATFVQLVYVLLMGRGAAPTEIEHYRHAFADSAVSRQDILTTFFVHNARLASKAAEPPPANDPTRAHLYGRTNHLTLEMWREQSETLTKAKLDEKPDRVQPTFSRFLFTSKQAPLVSIITSLFKGGRYIELFIDNMVSQTIFSQCELLIVDANSPEGEFEKAERFLKRYPNIKYIRYPSQIGIYEAWNICVQQARGLYCTNANLDDCRRTDSFELQAATLDALPFVDVVYQDVFYSFTENLSFEEIARHGFSTNLPIVSRYNLLEFNSPHNGPMWRKRLHEDVGLFDTSYRSAGDFDFWMRCKVADKIFYKINDAHVAYYVNPQGFSTRSDTPGAAESDRITKTFNRHLFSPHFTMDDNRFADLLARDADVPAKGKSRYAMVQGAMRHVSAASRSAQAARA